MTLRLCVVGNSHIGAFKRAWRRIGDDFGDVSLTMFGAPGRRFGDLDVREGRVVAMSMDARASLVATGGGDSIDLADHDALVIVGGNTRLGAIASLLKTCCPPFMNAELAGRDGAADAERLDRLRSFYRDHDAQPVSEALFRQFARAESAASNTVRLLEAMTRQSAIRLGHVATPFPSSALRSIEPEHVICRIADLGFGPFFAELAWKALEDVLPAGTLLVRPPGELLVGGMMTEQSFSQGSARLLDEGSEQREHDLHHMNDRYGEIMLRLMLEAMRTGGRPAAD